MLSIARYPTGNLERRLWELNTLNLDYQSRFSQADEFYIMLTELFEQHQFPSMIENSDREIEEDVLYMKEKGVEGGFDENDNQIKPLSMTVKTSRLEALIEAIQTKGTYCVEVCSMNKLGIFHLLLHRKE